MPAWAHTRRATIARCSCPATATARRCWAWTRPRPARTTPTTCFRRWGCSAMSSAASDICADFLVEVGEILDQLGEQMVALERAPADRECLNAVFRGFHTIKGGAGFLDFTTMVSVCHAVEDR